MAGCIKTVYDKAMIVPRIFSLSGEAEYSEYERKAVYICENTNSIRTVDIRNEEQSCDKQLNIFKKQLQSLNSVTGSAYVTIDQTYLFNMKRSEDNDKVFILSTSCKFKHGHHTLKIVFKSFDKVSRILSDKLDILVNGRDVTVTRIVNTSVYEGNINFPSSIDRLTITI